MGSNPNIITSNALNDQGYGSVNELIHAKDVANGSTRPFDSYHLSPHAHIVLDSETRNSFNRLLAKSAKKLGLWDQVIHQDDATTR